jgi:hypothetical protein
MTAAPTREQQANLDQARGRREGGELCVRLEVSKIERLRTVLTDMFKI